MKHVIIAALLATSIPTTHAVTISLSELPTEVQSCYFNSCFVDLESSVDFMGMSAHRYFNFNTTASSVFDGWLIRYNLTAPSRNTSYYDPSWGSDPAMRIPNITPYSGNVWLQASDSYDLVNSHHEFKIFTNTATPTPSDPNHISGLTSITALALTTADLQNGGGFVRAAGEYDYTVDGSLSRSMFTCVECGWTTDFNLVFLDYSTGTLSFNPNDQRSLLFSQSDYWVNFSNQDLFHVQAVPLPAALPLLGMGLALFTASGFRRRKKN